MAALYFDSAVFFDAAVFFDQVSEPATATAPALGPGGGWLLQDTRKFLNAQNRIERKRKRQRDDLRALLRGVIDQAEADGVVLDGVRDLVGVPLDTPAEAIPLPTDLERILAVMAEMQNAIQTANAIRRELDALLQPYNDEEAAALLLL